MNTAQVDKLVTAFVEYGAMGVVFLFLLAGWFVWVKFGKNGNGNGKAHEITNKRITDIGDKTNDNTGDIGELKGTVKAMKENHKELKEMIVKIAERVGTLEDKVDALIELLKPKQKEKQEKK